MQPKGEYLLYLILWLVLFAAPKDFIYQVHHR